MFGIGVDTIYKIESDFIRGRDLISGERMAIDFGLTGKRMAGWIGGDCKGEKKVKSHVGGKLNFVYVNFSLINN